ncbi:MAG: hypothetical protein ABJC63_04995 [Gemmatimonadales bacterium]
MQFVVIVSRIIRSDLVNMSDVQRPTISQIELYLLLDRVVLACKVILDGENVINVRVCSQPPFRSSLAPPHVDVVFGLITACETTGAIAKQENVGFHDIGAVGRIPYADEVTRCHDAHAPIV